MSVSPLEESLRRLTVIKAITRKNIDTTKDMKKKEIYRKRYERIDKELNEVLKVMKLDLE